MMSSFPGRRTSTYKLSSYHSFHNCIGHRHFANDLPAHEGPNIWALANKRALLWNVEMQVLIVIAIMDIICIGYSCRIV
jgi:hypothetical protein